MNQLKKVAEQPIDLKVSHSRIESIQVLRAVAAIAVGLAHLSVSFSMFGLKEIPHFISGNAGVDLFFVISGFIMVYSSESIFGSPGATGTFIRRRLIRIVPLYWAATAFQCYLYHRFGGFESYLPLWRNLISSLFFLSIPRDDGAVVPLLMVGWTLNFEILFYAIFSLVVPLRRSYAILLATAVLVGLVVAGIIAGQSMPLFLQHFTYPVILEFLMGVWIAIAYRSGITMKWYAAWSLICAGCCLIYFSPTVGYLDFVRTSTWGIGSALIVAASTLREGSNLISPNNIFVQIGEASYSMYLTHWFVLMTPPSIIVAIIKPAYHPVIYGVTMLCAVIVVAVIVHKYFERPLTLLLLRRSGPGLASA